MEGVYKNMKHFIDENGAYWGFTQDQINNGLSQGMRELTIFEFDQLQNPEKYLTDKEKAILIRQRLKKLSKRQFALYLYDHGMYDQVMGAINANPRFKIEYDSVSDIERLSPMVSDITTLLGWTDEQVDQMWEQASTL